METFPIILFHNINAANKCGEFVRIATGLGFKTLIISNAQGSAAQRGIPAAQKLAYKEGANFMALANVQDAIELFSPEEVIVVAPPPYGKEMLDADFVDSIEGKKTLIVFGGSDPGLSRKDLDMGRSVQIKAGDIGSIGTLAIGLALLKKMI